MNDQFSFDNEKIVYEVVADEVVLVNLDEGSYYMMEGSAALIWQMLAAGATLSQTVQLLQEVYASGTERIDAETREFVDALRASHRGERQRAEPATEAAEKVTTMRCLVEFLINSRGPKS